MGAPAGHPYAHPEGVCINGLGALPSPLMHTPSGCAYGCPAGAPIIGRDYFSFIRGRTSTRLRLVTGSYNANPSGWHMGNPSDFPL